MSQVAELRAWFKEYQLERHAPTLMDVSGSIGLSTVEDVQNLNEDDINDIIGAVSMNLAERKRFMRGVQTLKAAAAAGDRGGAATWPEGAAGKAAEPPEAVKGEAIMSGASPMRASRGGGGTFSAAATTRSLADAPPRPAAARAEPAESKVLQALHGDERIDAGRERYDELPAHADTYEVVKSTVFVLKEPRQDAERVGVVRQGNLIHCHRERVIGDDGTYWVELTNLELWRSCEPDTMEDRGFALINGSHLGLGQLLQGPLSRDFRVWKSMPPEALASSAAREMQPPVAPAPAARAAPQSQNANAPGALAAMQGPGAYATVYKVVKNLVYVKATPSKDATTVGCLKEGDVIQVFRSKADDVGGHTWVELTSLEMWRSCNPKDVGDSGFVLVDGTHLKLGPLLEGPGSAEDCTRWFNRMMNEYGRLAAKQKEQQDRFKAESADIEERISQGTFDNSTGTVYRAMHGTVYVKWGQDPRKAPGAPLSCRPGTALHTTGIEWFDAAGDQWVDGCCMDGRHRWYLMRGHQGDQEVPLLVPQESSANFMLARVAYSSSRGPQYFETFINKTDSPKALLHRFCEETKLNRWDVTLKMRDGLGADADVDMRKNLAANNVSEATVMYIQLQPSVFQLAASGRSLGWL